MAEIDDDLAPLIRQYLLFQSAAAQQLAIIQQRANLPQLNNNFTQNHSQLPTLSQPSPTTPHNSFNFTPLQSPALELHPDIQSLTSQLGPSGLLEHVPLLNEFSNDSNPGTSQATPNSNSLTDISVISGILDAKPTTAAASPVEAAPTPAASSSTTKPSVAPSGNSKEKTPRRKSRTPINAPDYASEVEDEEEDKRRRNTEASARFRAKKRQKELDLKQTSAYLRERADILSKEADSLRAENKWLRELIQEGSSGGSGKAT